MRSTLVFLSLISFALPVAAAETPRCLQLGADGQFVPRQCAEHDLAKLASVGRSAAKELESPVSFKFFGVGNIPSGVPVQEADPNMQYAALFDSDPSPNPGCSPFDRAFIAISGSFGAAPSPAKGTINYTPGGFGCGLYVQSGCFDYVQSPDDACFSFVTGGRSQLLIQGKPPFSAAFDDIGLGTQFAASVVYSDGSTEVASDLCTGLEGISVGEVSRFCNAGDVNAQAPIDIALEEAIDLARLEFDFGEFMGGPSEVDVNFSVAPNPVEVGQMFTLSWSAPTALPGASCLAGLGSPTPWSTLGAVENLGSVSYPAPTTPGTYFFGLTCEGLNNGFGSSGLELEVVPSGTPSALQLDIFPGHTAPGAVVSLTWNSSGVSSGTPCMPGPNWPIDGPLPASGEVSFAAPASGAPYTLSCAGDIALLERTVDLVISSQPPLPIASPAELISLSTSGLAGNAASRAPRVSARGEVVAFLSSASDLVGGGLASQQAYARNLRTGATDLISRDIQGSALPFPSNQLDLAADTSRAAFATGDGQVRAFDFGSAQGLGPISSASGGALGDAESSAVSLSADGRSAAFASAASNLIANAPSGRHIYLKTDNNVELISRPAAGFANGPSDSPALSADGSTVAFATDATNLGLGAGSGSLPTQICLAGPFGDSGRPRICVSLNPLTGLPGNAPSARPQLSADGRQGVFESTANNLVAGDSNDSSDVYWFSWDGRVLTGLVRVSTAANGEQADGDSYAAAISADGDTVSFVSDSTNLVDSDLNGAADVFVKHIRSGQIALLARGADGAQANAASTAVDISDDATTLVYESLASNLAANDSNAHADVYRSTPPLIYNRQEPGFYQLPLPAPQPANPFCAAGYFVAEVADGPVPGVEPGIFGLAVELAGEGTRELAGGLNFGGLVDAGQVGFAGVNIANATGELQRLDVVLTGITLIESTTSFPVRVLVEQPQADGSRTTLLELNGEIGQGSELTGSVEVAPGYYVASVQSLSGEVGGAAEGVFLFALGSQFLDRPGGGFQGGAVVGGYHADNPLGVPSAFAAFCIGEPYQVDARVLSAPTYGATGAGDLRLRLIDAEGNAVYRVPTY